MQQPTGPPPTRATAPALAPTNPLWLLALACFTSMASLRVCDSLLPKLADEFATTTGAAAQTISAFAIAYGVLQIAYGPLGDRRGRLPVIAWAAACCAVGNVAIALAPSLPATVAWRTVVGAASGGIVPLSIAFIGDTVAYERRQETLARLSMATILGMIAGQWLGGMVADVLGWRAVFYGLAVAFAAVVWPLWALARRHPRAAASGPPPGSFLHQLRQLLAVPWARVVLATTAVEGAFAFAAFAFVPSHLHREFGLSLGQAGAVMALYGLGGLSFAFGARWLIPRLGEAGLVSGGGALLGLAMAGLAFGPSWQWAAPACYLGGVGFYMLHSTLQTHATQMAPAIRGTAISLFVVCLFGGQAAGVALAALVVDHFSARWVFAATLVVMPVLALCFRHRLARRSDPPSPPAPAA